MPTQLSVQLHSHNFMEFHQADTTNKPRGKKTPINTPIREGKNTKKFTTLLPTQLSVQLHSYYLLELHQADTTNNQGGKTPTNTPIREEKKHQKTNDSISNTPY